MFTPQKYKRKKSSESSSSPSPSKPAHKAPKVEMDKIVDNLNNVVRQLEQCCTDLSAQFKLLQKDSKRKNIILYGCSEKQPEGWKELDKTIEDLSEKLKLPRKIDYDHALRLGKKKATGNRPILIKLVRQIDKFDILSRTKNLRGTSLSIDEDFTTEELAVKAIMRKKINEIKSTDKDSRIRMFVRRREMIATSNGTTKSFYVDMNLKILEKASTGNQTSDLLEDLSQSTSMST